MRQSLASEGFYRDIAHEFGIADYQSPSPRLCSSALRSLEMRMVTGLQVLLESRMRAMTYAKCLAFALPLGVAVVQAPTPGDHLQDRKLIMVRDQIEARGVKNPEVLAAMRAVPRA